MSYNRYDEESYYSPTEKVYPESGSEYRPPPPRNNIPLILLVLIVGIVIGVFVVRGFPQVATSIPVGPTQATTPAPTSPPGNATCPSNADDYFSVPTHRVTAGNACAFVLDRGQTTIPVGWSIQWTPSPVDGYQHVAFVTASPLTIALSGATARKIDVYALSSGDPFGDPNHPCRAAEKVVDASGNNLILDTTFVSACSGRPEDQKITVMSS